MWVLRFRGDKFSLIATPQLRFNGWLYAIQETSSHGFRDLVLGWHMSAREGGLTYFRFDGTSYQAVGQATYLSDDDGSEKIIVGFTYLHNYKASCTQIAQSVPSLTRKPVT